MGLNRSPIRVLLCHSSVDKAAVRNLYKRLQAEEGINPWLDKEDLLPGQDWEHEIQKAVRSSDAVLVCLSRRAVRMRSYLHKETRMALDVADEMPEGAIFVIPVRLDDCEVPQRLSRRHWVNLYENDGYDRLLRTLHSLPRSEDSGEEILPPRSWTRQLIWVALLIMLLALREAKVQLHRPSVAVLTFENRSGQEDIAWLSTALAEAASAKLGLAGDVRAVDRSEVALAEMDILRLEPSSKVSPRDLQRIRHLLGVELVLGGLYGRKGASSPIRLELILYDAREGRVVARTQGQGQHWLDLADRSTGDLPALSLRQKLPWQERTLWSNEGLRGLFPGNLLAAQLYFQGLAKYRSFDILEAARLFGRSAEIEPHPIALARLADMYAFLGRSKEAQNAIQRAIREAETRKTSRALPERYRREIDLIEREVATDAQGLAEKTYSFFQEFFPDDLSYGIIAAEALINAGSFDRLKPFIEELRLLPLAQDHPGVTILEADALYVQDRYRQAGPIARQAIEQAQELEAVRQEALARIQLASILVKLGCRDEAAEQFQWARADFDRMGDRINAAECTVQTALVYEGYNLSRAKTYYEQAIDRYGELGAQREKEQALRGLNGVLLQAGQLPEAERVSKKSASEDATAFLLEGALLYLKGEMEHSRTQLENAKARLDKKWQPEDYATALTNLGEIELMGGKPYIAEDLHDEALSIHEDLPSDITPYDMVCLGRVYMLTGEYSVARSHLDRALQWLKIDAENPRCGPESKSATTPDSVAWYEAHLAMAELELLSGHAELSEKSLRQVLVWARRDEFGPLQSRALSLQARRLLDEGRSSAAEEKVMGAMQLASGDFRAAREAQIASALLRADNGEVESAVKELYEIAADSARRKHVVYELESRLMAGKTELEKLGRGRDRLEKLRDKAAELHFGQIVQRVESILENR